MSVKLPQRRTLRRTDDIGEAFATVLAALEAEEALDGAQEAVLCGQAISVRTAELERLNTLTLPAPPPLKRDALPCWCSHCCVLLRDGGDIASAL